MKSESRRIDSSTATTVTSASSANVGDGGDQIPQRVRGEERGEQDRDRRRVERVRGDGVLARGFQLADDQQRDRDDDADGHANRRRQPAAIHRIAEEEHGGEHERDAGDRREQLHADDVFPVERHARGRGRRARRRRRWCRLRARSLRRPGAGSVRRSRSTGGGAWITGGGMTTFGFSTRACLPLAPACHGGGVVTDAGGVRRLGAQGEGSGRETVSRRRARSSIVRRWPVSVSSRSRILASSSR